MTRINRPDTLLTELREIRRRLGLLEAGRMRPPTSAAAGSAAPVGVPVPLMPARPADWPGTQSPVWERLVVTWAPPNDATVRLHLHVAADPGTAGQVRVVVDGEQLGEPFAVTPTPSTHTVTITGTGEIGVDARRSDGTGLVRAAALLLP